MEVKRVRFFTSKERPESVHEIISAFFGSLMMSNVVVRNLFGRFGGRDSRVLDSEFIIKANSN